MFNSRKRMKKKGRKVREKRERKWKERKTKEKEKQENLFILSQTGSLLTKNPRFNEPNPV